MYMLACLLASGLMVTDQENVTPDPTLLVQKAIASRRAIRSGQIEFHSKIWSFTGEKRDLQHERTTRVWFDANNIRGDMERPYPLKPNAKAVHEGSYREVNCLIDDKRFFWSDQKLPNDGKIMLHWLDRKTVEKRPMQPVYDPRVTGMVAVTSPNYVYYSLDNLALSKVTPAAKTSRRILDGIECYEVDFFMHNAVLMRVWIAPDRGHSVLRIEIDSRATKQHIVDSIEVKVKCDEESGIWFPWFCTYRRDTDGVQVEEEKLHVKVTQLNKAVEPQVFSVEGMGIPAGTHVSRIPRDERGELIWDGKSISPASGLQTTTKESNTGRRSVFLYSVILAGVAAGAILMWKRRPVAT